MSTKGTDPNDGVDLQANDTELALLNVLGPLIQLCLARGVKFQTLSDLTKLAYVQQAAKGPKPNVSQISVATGLHRKDVTRLLDERSSNQAPSFPRSLESEVFFRWINHPSFLQPNGKPKPLARQSKQDDDASFETLCWQITKDVHPRSILESMVRLGLVTELDAGFVELAKDSFVPSNEEKQMLALLAGNLSDHFAAAVSNVNIDGQSQQPFLEQAIFGRKISKQSVQTLHEVSRANWSQFTQAFMNAISELPESQDNIEPTNDASERFRVGMYFYHQSDVQTSPDKKS
jgi:Family of unknown function (DUF6502)